VKVAVFGLGYVGCVTGACIADLGHWVVGVDVNPLKVQMVNDGKPPVIEDGLAEFVSKVNERGTFTATGDWLRAVCEADVSLVCVGTPSNENGSLSLDVVRRVTSQIGDGLKNRRDYSVVAIRSTVLPGTVEGELIPLLEKHSGKMAGRDFGVCMVPEFLREGSSLHDFFHPPKCVIGQLDQRSGDTVAALFETIEAPMARVPIKVAEMVKYADNAFHALKVTFANEIGNICKELACDSHHVMEVFCLDRKLNLSPYYLKPGFAFGGSCLPKDVRALTHRSKLLDVPTPVLSAILDSNKKQIEKVVKQLSLFKGRTLGFLGLSFKHGTDDLRESPMVELIETMLGKGFAIKIYDEYVSIARLVGSNKEYIEKEIPHISSLMCDTPQELIDGSDVVVIGTQSADVRDALSRNLGDHHVIIDLVRIPREDAFKGQYHGICW